MFIGPLLPSIYVTTRLIYVNTMKSIKRVIERDRLGLRMIRHSIVNGIFVGTFIALILPTISTLRSLLSDKFSSYRITHLEPSPWVHVVIKPDHLFALLIVLVICIVFACRSSLVSLLRRCQSAMTYDAAILWTACAFFMWREPRWSARVLFGLTGILVTWAIVHLRTPFAEVPESFSRVDRPIRSFSEDKLDRKPLIDSLAQQLFANAAPVVALIGAYGDGKTSILCLLEHELKNRKTVVVRFKSSLPGDHLTLVSTLFNSISKQLRGHFFIHRLGSVLRRFARKLSGLVPEVPSGLKEIFSEPSQQAELEELTETLATLPVHRVAVLLDDMDRMQPAELRMLLKIIRATEDYPKLSFVCAFNKKALVDALIRHQVIDRLTLSITSKEDDALSGTIVGQIAADDTRAGYEYLEKFFPVQVPVPKLDEVQIGKEFDARFNQFAERNGLSLLPEDTNAFDKEFSQRFWKQYFLPWLTNLRKINSYFNALNTSFPLVKDEVNLIDFLCIELLRQTEPEIYDLVFSRRSLFYYPEWDVFRWDERSLALDAAKNKKMADAAFDQIFRHLKDAERSSVLSLLSELFPKVNAYTGARSMWSTGEPTEEDADTNKRIYHPNHFTTYFSLHVQEGYLSSKEVDNLIVSANESPTASEAQAYFVAHFRSLKGVKKYRFLEKITRMKSKLGKVQQQALVLAVALEANSLTHDDFELGEFGAAVRLIVQITKEFKASSEITDLLSSIVQRSTSDALVQRIYLYATDKEKEVFPSLADVDVSNIKQALATRMKTKYFVGSKEPIYSASRTFRDWQLLVSWSQVNDEELMNVRNYLAYEFEKWPASVGMHALWLRASVDNPSGEKIVDAVFPLSQLAEIAKKRGSECYSNESEKSAVMHLISKYGGSANTV